MEAYRLEQLGNQYAEEQRRTGVKSARQVLMNFPESPMTARRWIEVVENDDALEYRLMEQVEDSVSSPPETPDANGAFVLGSDSAVDVLERGYELGEQERLGELLAPYSERIEAEGVTESIDPLLVQEIETIVAADELAAGARMRARADIVDFLEGRLEPSAFITAAIERHGQRETEFETIARRRGERQLLEPL